MKNQIRIARLRLQTLRLSTRDVVTAKAIDRFAKFKAKILAQAEGVVTHV
jgi:hypothetical protein